MSDIQEKASIDPDFADRFFGEKIITRDYKRLLVVMVDNDNSTHVWGGYDGQYCDRIGLAHLAIMQTHDNWNDSQGKNIDPETGGVD
jgi:hypothetical protein